MLKFAHRLKTAGVPSIQAEAEADALAEVFEANLSELSTKADLREVETNLRHEISNLRKDMDSRFAGMNAKLEKTGSALRQEMSDMKFELLKWLIGLTIAQVGLVIGLLKFLP